MLVIGVDLNTGASVGLLLKARDSVELIEFVFEVDLRLRMREMAE